MTKENKTYKNPPSFSSDISQTPPAATPLLMDVFHQLSFFCCGALATQRFILEPLNTLVCIIPFSFCLKSIFGRLYNNAVSYIAIALALIVDNGGDSYQETPLVLRYPIFLVALCCLYICKDTSVSKKFKSLAIILAISILLGTISGIVSGAPYEWAALRRDVLVLIVLMSFTGDKHSIKLNMRLLFNTSLGYLFGELLNIRFFYEPSVIYLSYNSLKVWIVLPFLYSIIKRYNILIKAGLFIGFFFVVTYYGTRMIILSTLLLFGLILVVFLVKNKSTKIQLRLASFIFVIVTLSTINISKLIENSELSALKAASFIVDIYSSSSDMSLLDKFALLDPIRAQEFTLFTDRTMPEIVFGSGLGSGLLDREKRLSFIDYDTNKFTFTPEELAAGKYFNLHDFSIDYGLRFGILPVIFIVYVLIIKPIFQEKYAQGALYGLILINATWSTAGILFLSFLVRFWPKSFMNPASSLKDINRCF